MGITKSARPAKRSASSSFSTVSTVIFVAFCVFGVYMLTSSSLLGGAGGGSAPATRVTKLAASDPEERSEKPLIEEVVEEKRERAGQKEEEEEEEERAPPETKPEAEVKSEESDENGGGESGEEKQEDVREQQSETKVEETQSDDSDQHQSEGEKSDKSEEDQPQSSGEENVASETFSDTNRSDANGEDGSESEKKVEGGEGSDGEKKVEGDDGSDGEKKKVEKDDGSDGEKEKVEKDEGLDGEKEKVEKDDGLDGEKKKVEEDEGLDGKASSGSGSDVHNWLLCNTTAGFDYIPCLDNEEAIKKLHRRHYEHRERHCPEEPPSCLVPIPEGYKQSIEWPKSRDKIWYHNVPHTKLAVVKGHQNWVKVTGEYLTFPGGGTQFVHGALHYIDFLRQAVPKLAWGKHTRVILDVGCGVASFGGYLFERDALAMSFAPKDEHEAQVQFALERGIPAISAVMGTQRLLFPSKVFDAVHCARCRVPWHVDGGMLLLELNRVLRPGGYFLWSATPVYQKLQEDVEIWHAMKSLTAAMCWDLITIKKDKLNGVGAAIFRKPTTNECYEKRKQREPPMCKEDDDPNAAWYVPLQACMHKVPVHASEQGTEWPVEWPRRLRVPPNWLNNSQTGIYGKPAPADFSADYDHWKRIVSKSYLSGLGIDWSNVRNVMDMKAIYGGFAAALNDLKLWVMNVVNVDSPDTLPIIYDRGLFGIYHDWCESFSTYPRTYDLLHADHLFSGLKKRCNLVPVMAEVDRILRPSGKLIVRDEPETISEVESLLKSLHWEIRMTFNKEKLGMLSAQKMDWRPREFASQ